MGWEQEYLLVQRCSSKKHILQGRLRYPLTHSNHILPSFPILFPIPIYNHSSQNTGLKACPHCSYSRVPRSHELQYRRPTAKGSRSKGSVLNSQGILGINQPFEDNSLLLTSSKRCSPAKGYIQSYQAQSSFYP